MKSVAEGFCFVFASVPQRCRFLEAMKMVELPGSERLIAESNKLSDALIDGPLFYAKCKRYDTTSTETARSGTARR